MQRILEFWEKCPPMHALVGHYLLGDDWNPQPIGPDTPFDLDGFLAQFGDAVLDLRKRPNG